MTKKTQQFDTLTPDRKEGTENRRPCPHCQMPKEEWPHPKGFRAEDVLYCCEGCARNTGCTCGQEQKGKSLPAVQDDTSILNRDIDRESGARGKTDA